MGEFRSTSISLDTEFVIGPGLEEAVCVDLEGEPWSEVTKVHPHPDLKETGLEFVSGEVGEGGDHVNIVLKNNSQAEINIPGNILVAFLSEDPNAQVPSSDSTSSNPSTESEISEGQTNVIEAASSSLEELDGGGSKDLAGSEEARKDRCENIDMDVDGPDLSASTVPTAGEIKKSGKLANLCDKSDKDDSFLNEVSTSMDLDTDSIETVKITNNSLDLEIADIHTVTSKTVNNIDIIEKNKVDTEKGLKKKFVESEDKKIKELQNNKDKDSKIPKGLDSKVLIEDSKVATPSTEEKEINEEKKEGSQDNMEKNMEVEKEKNKVEEVEKSVQQADEESLTRKGETVKDGEGDKVSKETEVNAGVKAITEASTEKLRTVTEGEATETEIPVFDVDNASPTSKEEEGDDESVSEISQVIMEDEVEKVFQEVGEKLNVDKTDSENEKNYLEEDKIKNKVKEKEKETETIKEKSKSDGDNVAKESKEDEDGSRTEGTKDTAVKDKPPIMRFVNETEADDVDLDKEDDDQDYDDVMEVEDDEKERPDKKNKDDEKEKEEKEKQDEKVKEDEKKNKDDIKVTADKVEDKRPTLKLASFADMAAKKPNESAPAFNGDQKLDDGCSECQAGIASLKAAVVWETMQFCNVECLAKYQSGLSSCSSCKKSVFAQSLGKYCVRFGSDIKQFCSNLCLEDYKKGLKVCSYCQKDISGGEGFLAPIGNKGQFKDFCEQNCLQRYEVMNNLKEEDKETLCCSVCQETKLIQQHIIRADKTIKLCSMDSCFSAYKFGNKMQTEECGNCKKHFDVAMAGNSIYFDGCKKSFCCKACQNVSVMVNRKIVPCKHCRVKKYNFDMIEIFEDGPDGGASQYCSLHCRNLLKAQSNQPLVPMRTVNSSVVSSFGGIPVISSITSLMNGASLPDLPTQPLPQAQLQQQIQIQTQTVTEVVKETQVLPPEVPEVRNKCVQTRPVMVTKGVSCKPTAIHKSCQTDGPVQPTLLPLPVPVHIPVPCHMYNIPFPVPIPIPLPFPVPVFIPTTRNSMKGIMKQIKKIQNKIPADPFEAELLALAGNIAAEDKDSSEDSEDEGGCGRDDDGDELNGSLHSLAPQSDLENEMTAEKIVPKPLPLSTPEPPGARQFNNFSQYPNKRRASQRDSEADDPDTEDEAWKPQATWGEQRPPNKQRQPATRRQRGRGTPQVKRSRVENSSRDNQSGAASSVQQPKERPDVNHHLKFTYGVNAWKHWVVGKNAELEKQRAQGKYQKTFETDILKLRADELNFTLCMFVKEVKKPNGDSYAADSILYLVLGIQEYLFENGRIDNIFTDVYYDPFTTALHEVVKDFKLPVNELGYFVTRIEEEHLWESKQLGAHSPHVLLNTLVYFNTKYFQLKTVDQHLKLSFSHIMKHWKKSTVTKAGQQQRTVLLRYYPPPAKGQKNDDRKMYEQHENHDNPLRCPVKLYEFYLSKKTSVQCPESTKNRNDMFYLQPERSCVPDSPVWYSAQLLNRFSMEKMLSRLLMVREVQEHMLADQ